MKSILTFILAGGKGERLHPLTKERAKPAVPFGGPYRIIDFTLSNCLNSGLRKIHILTQYKSHSLNRHLRMGWSIFDGELGEYIDVIPAQQRVGSDWYKGTADAIYQNMFTVGDENPDEVFILAGDHIYKMDYSNMVKFHRENNSDVTVGVVGVESQQITQLGIVKMDSSHRIIDFVEKPQDPNIVCSATGKIYASMGIYLFNRSVLEKELEQDAKNDHSDHDFGKNVIPQMIKKGLKLKAYDLRPDRANGIIYWRDIGTLDAYYEANMDLISVDPHLNLYDKNWPVRTYHRQSPPAKTVFSGDFITGRIGLALDSLMCEGCIVSGGKVQHSILSPDVRVNSYSEVVDSILMDGVNVGRYARIRRAIIDKYVDIPQGTYIGYDLNEDKKRFFVTESGIVIVSKGTIVS